MIGEGNGSPFMPRWSRSYQEAKMENSGYPVEALPSHGIILAEVLRRAGVPETGGYDFVLLYKHPSWPSSWTRYERDGGDGFCHYGVECFLRWWPANEVDPSKLTLTTRTNFKWQPSNGTGGDIFYSENCARCIRERPIREDYDAAVAQGQGCDIYMRSMAYSIAHPEYPEEWTDREGDPQCTAFELDTGQPTQEPRCKQTLELFP